MERGIRAFAGHGLASKTDPKDFPGDREQQEESEYAFREFTIIKSRENEVRMGKNTTRRVMTDAGPTETKNRQT